MNWTSGKSSKLMEGRKREQISLLVGDVLVKQLDAGPEGNKLKFSSAQPLPSNALLTEDGIFTFLPTHPENVALVIVAEDQCGYKEYKEMIIQVSPCLCKNGGTCQRFTNFTLGTGKKTLFLFSFRLALWNWCCLFLVYFSSSIVFALLASFRVLFL